MNRFLLLFLIISICIPGLPFLNAEDSNIPFWSGKAGTPAQRFELAKRSTPELIAFMRRMPKGGDLHNHIGGSVYSEHILDRAAGKNLRYDLEANRFTRESADKPNVVTIDEVKGNPDYMKQYLDHASMRGWYTNGGNGHDHFFSAFSRTRPGRRDDEVIIAELVKRNRYQNLQYLELMAGSIPREVISAVGGAITDFSIDQLDRAFAQIEPLLKDSKLQASIREYLDLRDAQIIKLLGQEHSITGDRGGLVVRYIHQLNRLRDTRTFFISAVSAMFAVKTDSRVVAFNMVAPEDWPRSRENFQTQMAILDFLWAKMGKPRVSLHAGELVLRESPLEPMMDRISASVEKGHAQRIGHGISIAWEKDVVGLLEKMRTQGIMVEICPSSNFGILGIKGRDHPFYLYRRAGVPISINTDDEGVSRSNMTMEFVKAIQDHNLTYDDVKEFIRNSLEYSFLPGKSLYKSRDYSQLHKAFLQVRSLNWRPGKAARRLMRRNSKMARQVILERALVNFEEFLLEGFRPQVKEKKPEQKKPEQEIKKIKETEDKKEIKEPDKTKEEKKEDKKEEGTKKDEKEKKGTD
ncbi:MAG: hypothetical protein GY940_35055 [bacterium]|nr:hypothetical protein [bacterium]